MKYYHGSPNGNLTELKTQKSNDGYIWLAEDYCFALLYAGNPVRFWAVDKESGRLIIREVQPNSLELMYKNKPCYIYSISNVGEFEQYNFKGRKSIRLNYDVKIEEKEFIPDAYEKMLELEKQGILILRRWNDLTLEQQEDEKASIIRTFKPVMQEEFNRFPDEYKLLTELFEELKLENIEKENIKGEKENE